MHIIIIYFSNNVISEYNLLLLYRIDNIKHIAMTKKANFYAIHGAFYYLLCSVLVILMVSGCTRDVYDPNGGGEDKPNSFDFSTTSTIQLNVKYDVPEGYKVLFNVYFEDPFDSALRQKIEGIDRREKFRLRYYGSDTSFVKLERKIKYKGLCSKQSAKLSTEDVRHILNGEYGFLLDRNDPVCVDFYSKLQGNMLRPRVVVRYEREAFSYFPGNVRVTIDRGLRSSLNTIDFLTPFSGRVPVTDGAVVVEVKFDEFLPEVVQLALAPLGQQARAYSKYAFCRRLD